MNWPHSKDEDERILCEKDGHNISEDHSYQKEQEHLPLRFAWGLRLQAYRRSNDINNPRQLNWPFFLPLVVLTCLRHWRRGNNEKTPILDCTTAMPDTRVSFPVPRIRSVALIEMDDRMASSSSCSLCLSLVAIYYQQVFLVCLTCVWLSAMQVRIALCACLYLLHHVIVG